MQYRYANIPDIFHFNYPFSRSTTRSGRDLSQNMSPITIEEEPKTNANPRIEDNVLNKDNILVLIEQPIVPTRTPPLV
jgi:hypothetical protein